MNETTSPVHENIIDALAAAQGEFGEITKNCEAEVITKSGAKYKYKYADLGHVLAATRPILAKHGLAVSWVYRSGDKSGEVVTRLLHRSGDLESVIPVYSEGGTLSAMQSLGSAITYAKRYGLCGLIGVVAEDDDDGAGAGTPPKQEPRREPQQRQQRPAANGSQQTRERSVAPPASNAKPADKPAPNGEKKPLIEQIKDRIKAAADPAAIVDILAKSAQKWADKQQFLEEIFNLCAEENKSRAMNGFTYDNVGKSQQWDEEDRKWVFSELAKIMDGLGKEPAAEQPDEPVDWPTRVAAVTKSDEMFAIINEMSDDADLTSDMNAFNAVCGLITAKLDASAAEWGDGATKITRQFLSNRITAVELDHAAKEAMNNATAS